MKPYRFRHAMAVAAVGLFMCTASSKAATETFEPPSSLAGSYLAGRTADLARDVDAALGYFEYALKEDPGNGFLIERVLELRLAAGEIKKSFDFAEKLILTQNRDLSARTALAVSAMRDGRFDLAVKNLKETGNSPLAALTSGLLEGWALEGRGETDAALKAIDDLTGPSWFDLFKDYHKAMIADVAGRGTAAVEAITRAYEAEATTFRVVEAYARILSRAGKRDEAVAAVNKFLAEEGDNPLVRDVLTELTGAKQPSAIVGTPAEGAAEALYGIGALLAEQEPVLAAAYLQLGHYLRPNFDPALATLANIFQANSQCEKAIDIYGRIGKASPLFRNVSIQTSQCLNTLGRTDEAAKELRILVDADPADMDAVLALGNLYRGHERYAEAVDALSIGVEAIKEQRRADWYIYYTRGVAYERTKRWALAEADFKQALKLYPNQPQVLNYLGYSWVDMGQNLDEALRMIQTAVELRPNDGAIVDSLGWAYYRLGRYEDAVETLERAIDLQPEDPVINDHLGDAYWQVGRKREATFQWAHARDLKPAEADLAKILDKLQNGLKAASIEAVPAATPISTAEAPQAKPTPVASIDPVQQPKAPAATLPTSITVRAGESLGSIAERLYGNREFYIKIYEANKDRIPNPDVITPGMTLTIPAADTH
jgi:tetratricopeptide (TPR) repeat protein